MAITLQELKDKYAEKGGTTQRITQSGDAGDVIDYLPNDLGEGFQAREDQPIIGYEGQGMDATPIYGDKVLSGFMQAKDGMDYFYDPEGVFQGSQKSQEADTFWDTFGPLIMGAVTMGGGAGALGSYLFPSLGATAAAGAGGALAGGFNAAMTDQDILAGALKGGVGSAGALELGDTGFTLGDATKAINFAQNPSAAGAVNLFAPSVGGTQIGDTGVSLGDVFKGVGTAKALGSGDNQQIFNAITGLARDQGGNLKSSLAGFDTNPDDFIQGYFQPGGEGYIDPNRGEMTVRQEPENLDTFLRELSPYAVDGGKSIFAQEDDIPEFETVSNRPITSIESLLGTPNILETVEADVPELTITDKKDEPYVPGIRTKDIKSDIPDELNVDDIATLFPNLDINDILQIVTSGGTKAATPITTTTPKITAPTPGAKTTQETMANLGLNAPMPSQDPYANIKLMEELFGGDTAYKLRALGAPKNLASADIDALARMLRG